MPEHDSVRLKEQYVGLLRQTEAQLEIFKRFVETSGQAWGMADLEGRIFFVNSILCRLIGEENPEDAYQHDFFDYYTPETVKRLQEEILPLVRQEGQWVGELTLIDKQARATPTIENIFLLRDETGKPLCFATVITDLSERIRMEQELRTYRDQLEHVVSERTGELEKSNALLHAQIAERKQTEEERTRLAAILESTSDLVAISTSDGRIIYINAASRQLGGWKTDDEILTHNLSEVHPAWALKIVLEEGIPNAIAHGVWRGETAVITTYGLEIPVSQVIMAHRSASGEVEYLATIMRDISERKKAEEALRTSEAQYRLLYSSMRDAYVRVELDGRIREFNAAYVEMLGYQPEELKAFTYHDITPEKWHAFEAEIHEKQVFQRGYSDIYEKEYRRNDGTVLPVELRAVLLRDDAGKPSGMWAIVRDISERKRAEEALRESEQRFRGLAEAMTQLVWVVDEDGRSTYHNPQFIEYTGLKASTNKERSLLIHPEDRPVARMKWKEGQSSGGVFQNTFRLRCRDGTYHWFLCRVVLIHDVDHRWVRWFGTASNIDDLKRTEQALQDNLDILAKAEHIGHTGSWRRDLATGDIIWSAGTHRLIGFPEDEEISFEQFKSRIHPDDRDGLMGKLVEATEKGIPFMAEFRIVLPDGTIRHIEGRGEASLDIEGKPVHIHGTVLDITERKRLEDELIKAQRLDSIGTLAGGIAHDYNNLLTAILGYMELAKMNIPQDGGQAYALLTQATNAAMKARDLTQQLITFSLGGNPHSKIMPIRNLLSQSVKLALSGSGTKPEWKIADNLPEVKIDANQIRQVIHNIVINAQEAMPHGGTLFIEADTAFIGPDKAVSMNEGNYVRLAFRDEGHGIPAENLPKIFDPYFTTKEMGCTKGMGLSLPICYSIIKRHGGDIMVDSQVGIGTTITLYIPAAGIHLGK